MYRTVSDKAMTGASFFASSQSTQISGLGASLLSHTVADVVNTISMDDFVDAEGVQNVDYSKTDTEGYDLMVQKGLPWYRMRPSVTVREFKNRTTIPLGYDFHDITDFIPAKGYSAIVSEWFQISKYGRGHRWRRYATYPCDLADDAGWGNLIASNDDELLAKIFQKLEAESARA